VSGYVWVDERQDESWWDTIERIAEQTRCEFCGAQPDDPCTTASGHRASRLHYMRTLPIQNANVIGYSQGERDARQLRSAS
jgi:hypothetical protein